MHNPEPSIDLELVCARCFGRRFLNQAVDPDSGHTIPDMAYCLNCFETVRLKVPDQPSD